MLTLAEKFQGSFEGAPELDKELDFKKISGKVEKLELHHALDEIWAFIRACNKYINDKGPWKLEGKELGHVLYNLLEGLRVIAILIRPFMPDTSEEINRQLGVKAGTFKDLKFRKFEGKPRKGKHLFEKVKAPGAPTEAKGPEARKISVAIDKGAKNLGINAKAAVISGVKVKKKHSGLEKLKKETSKSLKLDVSGERNIQGFKELYKKLGADISKHPLELLLDAVKKTGKIPTINTVVDSYNLVAAKRLVSAGAHDLDRIEGNVRFKVTDGTEPWTPLGTKGKQKVPKGEYACVDEKKVICRMDVKQCEQTKVGENTKNVFLYVQGNKNIPEEELAKALEEACQNIVKFCGGSWKELLIQ
ncbi:MAG: phenylalanine--tRNA ligase beta subunit-related protein [Candidatus Aenigmatarchaeota archaeon]